MCVGATGSAACSTNTNSPRSDRSRFPNWQPVCLRSAPLKSCASLAGGVSVDLLSAKRIGKRRPSRPEPVKVETNQISGTYTLSLDQLELLLERGDHRDNHVHLRPYMPVEFERSDPTATLRGKEPTTRAG